MRIYIYKVIIFVVAIFFLYQLTVGYTIHNFQKKIFSSFDKETSGKIKDKIRHELESSLKKDNILKKEDAILLKSFLDKISSELKEIK
tara:strand:+ start:211 stop:474 length:264 start_codon:yes stop_codon:yes gene_type:complete